MPFYRAPMLHCTPPYAILQASTPPPRVMGMQHRPGWQWGAVSWCCGFCAELCNQRGVVVMGGGGDCFCIALAEIQCFLLSKALAVSLKDLNANRFGYSPISSQACAIIHPEQPRCWGMHGASPPPYTSVPPMALSAVSLLLICCCCSWNGAVCC